MPQTLVCVESSLHECLEKTFFSPYRDEIKLVVKTKVARWRTRSLRRRPKGAAYVTLNEPPIDLLSALGISGHYKTIDVYINSMGPVNEDLAIEGTPLNQLCVALAGGGIGNAISVAMRQPCGVRIQSTIIRKGFATGFCPA